ncbi:epidermal growth factor-like protein 8 [Calonectris borealis]|uniref:epidermal growth factor-like protein 8 n=1 Tax=Calonectris borealis TaxID=1323832 RepID=UPI003F4CAB5C
MEAAVAALTQEAQPPPPPASRPPPHARPPRDTSANTPAPPIAGGWGGPQSGGGCAHRLQWVPQPQSETFAQAQHRPYLTLCGGRVCSTYRYPGAGTGVPGGPCGTPESLERGEWEPLGGPCGWGVLGTWVPWEAAEALGSLWGGGSWGACGARAPGSHAGAPSTTYRVASRRVERRVLRPGLVCQRAPPPQPLGAQLKALQERMAALEQVLGGPLRHLDRVEALGEQLMDLEERLGACDCGGGRNGFGYKTQR